MTDVGPVDPLCTSTHRCSVCVDRYFHKIKRKPPRVGEIVVNLIPEVFDEASLVKVTATHYDEPDCPFFTTAPTFYTGPDFKWYLWSFENWWEFQEDDRLAPLAPSEDMAQEPRAPGLLSEFKALARHTERIEQTLHTLGRLRGEYRPSLELRAAQYAIRKVEEP